MNAHMMAALAGVALLAACGGGGDGDGGGVNAPSFQERVDAAAALGNRVEALAPSGDTAVPETGTARFQGNALVLADTNPFDDDTASTALLGEMRIDADFADASLSGSATNFFGTIEETPTRAYEGTLTLTDEVAPKIA